jgi:MFS family permease
LLVPNRRFRMPSQPGYDPTAYRLNKKRQEWQARKRAQRLPVIVLTIASMFQWAIFFYAVPWHMEEHGSGSPGLIAVMGVVMTLVMMVAILPLLPKYDRRGYLLTKEDRNKHWRTRYWLAIQGIGMFGATGLGLLLHSDPWAFTILGIVYVVGLNLTAHLLDPYPTSS